MLTSGRTLEPYLGAVVATVIAWFAFTLPDRLDAITFQAFARLPLEWPLLLLLLLAVPRRLRRPVGVLCGLVLLLILFLKVADIGTREAFQRPFNPYLDIKMMADGWNLFSGTVGTLAAFAAVAAALVGLLVVLLLFLWAAARLTEIQRPGRSWLVLSLVTITLFGGTAFLLNAPRVEARMPSYLNNRLTLVIRSVQDMHVFETALSRGEGPRNGAGLFGRVRDKDFVLIFVESYGRSAVEDPRYASITRPRMESVQTEIERAGLASASAWVTAPTVGGLSWLAHGTLLSGLWVDSQARYDRLMISQQPSLNRLFAEAGWKSIAVMPAITMDWPEAAYYGYRQILAAADLDYQGKPFNWVTMPDQYTLSAFERLGRAPARAAGERVMAEVALISSHAPWTPVARLIDWDAVGDGSIFNEQAESGDTPRVVWADPERVRAQYIQTIDYSLETLGSYMARFGEDTVFVILGDHQPAAIITGPNASRAVPIHVVSADRDLVARFEREGFLTGMLPGTQTREWPMNEMRQVLIDLFSQP
ncbi:MAG: sulfatase [Agrobacterium sp. SCN 61-19]|nr:MAG: sulfatase [Agrobacterium sp. SCN 61-19]